MKSNEKTAAGKEQKKKKKSKNKKPSSPYAQFILAVIKTVFVIFISVGCVLAGILGGAVLGYINTAPDITPDQLDITKQTSFIYDKDGTEIAQIKGSENRIIVEHAEIPDNMRYAFISIEDQRFHSHSGVDFRRFISAAVSYIINFGDAEYGGSTITQQLVKNITGNDDSTIKRKVQEAYQALKLEGNLSKDQILDNYMNRINTGYGVYGVQAAAKKFFNKDVTDLSLAEITCIAGITKAPGLYDPTLSEKNRERNKERQKYILDKMLELGHISQNEYDEALSENLKFYDGKSEDTPSVNTVQSYFVDYVISEVKKDLMENLGLSSNEATIRIYNNGIKIYTTQDSEIQKIMTEEFVNPENFPANEKISNPDMQAQGAMLVIDPANGQIRGMYGSYGEKKANFTLNRATSMKRQPGSSFKPIAVYAPAIDLGLITPGSIFDDVPIYYDTKKPNDPYPTNYESGTYEGLISLRNAIRKSQNVVAAQVWRDYLGADNSVEYLKKVGIDRSNEKYVSMALGGLNEGVNPLLMAAAYVPFVNKGVYLEPIAYTKVTDSRGNVILDKTKDQNKNIAYKETTAFLMTSMLREVVTNGTAGANGKVVNQAKKIIPTAGKTGTSGDWYDKWFVGYSPYYVGATWYGYNMPKTLKSSEYNQALMLWNKVMNKIHANLEVKDFEKPEEGIVERKICIYSGKTPGPYCSLDVRGGNIPATIRTEYFAKGTEPSVEEICDVHVLERVDTTSLDLYGRPLLANEFCPPEVVKEKVFIRRPIPYLPKDNLPKSPAALIRDWMLEVPQGEYCTIHGAYEPVHPPVTNTTPGTNQSSDPSEDLGEILDVLP